MKAALIAGLATAAAAVARGTHRHRTFFECTHHELFVAGLHPRHQGLRLAQLSDLHLGLSTPASRIRAAVAAVNAAKVDLVALTGDYVTHSMGPVPLVSQLLAGLRAPVFAVLGNHDHWVDARGVAGHLERAGCTVLQNAHRQIRLRGAPLYVIGIDDERSGHDDVAAALSGLPARGSRLVLAHTPPTVLQLPRGAGLLCLSGHTHGGQIKVPGLTRGLLRRMGQPFERGLHQVNGNLVYVNRGLGYGIGGAALRLGSKPEVSFFTLRRKVR